MSAAVKFLRDKEWSMGNGQCPECCAVHEGWLGHPLHLASDSIGHKSDCKLALSLKDLGERVTMLGEFKSDKRYEIDWSSGFLDTKLVTL